MGQIMMQCALRSEAPLRLVTHQNINIYGLDQPRVKSGF